MVSEQALKEFKEVYRAEFGKEISDTEALELATNFLTFFNAIYRPIKKSWLAETKK